MVFLMSVLVFIAGIMTYMFFPRNDQFQINMYEDEGNIVTFLNQHQAAKDYLYQMIKWQPSVHPASPAPYGFAYNDLASMMPSIMRGDRGNVTHDISDEEDEEAIAPNIPISGYFTSAAVCLNPANNELANCPTDKQYVMTYGYTPHWWNDKTNRKETWLKSLLKRSHGSDNCGVLDVIDDHYVINNGQKYNGIITTPIGGKMQKVLPATLSNWIDNAFPDEQDILICLSSIKNVYKGTPVFQWDSINNGGDNHINGLGIPLIGSFNANDTLLDADGNPLILSTYSITGVVNGNESSATTLLSINAENTISETCSGDTCNFTIGNVEINGIPSKTPYAFVYTTQPTGETLQVYYSEKKDKKIEWTFKETSSATPGPAFLADARMYEETRPLELRIYAGIISNRDINHNIKADKKRFGL